MNQVLKGFENGVQKLCWKWIYKVTYNFVFYAVVVALLFVFYSSACLPTEFTKPFFWFHYSQNVHDSSTIPIVPSDRDPSKVIKQFNSLSKILDRWKNAEYEYMPQCSKKWKNSAITGLKINFLEFCL